MAAESLTSIAILSYRRQEQVFFLTIVNNFLREIMLKLN